jgi:general secretion pathway protein D
MIPSQPPKSPDERIATGPGPRSSPAERPPGEDDFQVVPLKYADVSEVVGLLTEGLSVKSNDIFIPREPNFGSAGVGGQAYNPQPPPNADVSDQPLGQSVDNTIGIDRRLNAVILRGSPEKIARLKAQIAQIDVPVQSVILETVFVELTESGARNVGLDFNNANSQIAVGTFQKGQFIPPGFPIDHGLSSAQLQAAIYAQVRAGRGRIVSKPRISAQSGSSAKIITGDALPILTSITLSGVNGVSQQVQYVNVGVTLQILPRVSGDGYVTSHVFCVVSSVTGFSQGYPTISQREAQSLATVRDGETFVIGGLSEENELSTRDKVPGVGDIPGLGQFFRLHKGTQSKTELYIVVTPRVVKPGEAPPPPPAP